MNLYTQETIERMADRAWKGYAMVHAAINALEDAGLTVETGSKPGNEDAGAMYGAMTACSDIIREAYGLEGGTIQAEKLDMYLSDASRDHGITDAMPEDVKARIHALVREQTRQASDGTYGAGTKQYEVTVAMFGGISVTAASSDGAISAVNAMETGAIVAGADWEMPEATDASRRD